MRPSTVERLKHRLDSPILVGEGVSEDEIAGAETLLEVTVVADYRWFLRTYGGAMVGSFPIYGLRCAEVMGDLSVIDATRLSRRNGNKLTQDVVVVSTDGWGNPIGLAKDGRVWLSDHDSGDDVLIAESFEDLLVKILEGRVFD